MPHKTDWREMIPALEDVFIFQGALYCIDCGQAIQKQIRQEGRAPEDEKDEDSFDSDDFPKGPYGDGGGEADGPQHCDSNDTCLNVVKLPGGSKIGAWLGNSLTSDGIREVARAIIEDLGWDTDHGRQVGRLWACLYRDQLSGADGPIQLEGRDLESPLVKSFIQLVCKQQDDYNISKVMVDLNNIYGISYWKKRKPAVVIWKSEINPYGSPSRPTDVELPLSEAGEREPIDILHELIGEGAWD